MKDVVDVPISADVMQTFFYQFLFVQNGLRADKHVQYIPANVELIFLSVRFEGIFYQCGHPDIFFYQCRYRGNTYIYGCKCDIIRQQLDETLLPTAWENSS